MARGGKPGRRTNPPRRPRGPKRVRAATLARSAPVDIVEEPPRPDATIVGVGASAGGLDAFSQVLEALPPEPGFAMVLVQHLAPQHESALPTLLSGKTSMPVVQATE